MLGTTDYVSPEQALGHDVDRRSRTSTRSGSCLYEMLTGDVPFHGENQVAVAMKHVREDLPDVQIRRPEVSAALAAVVDHATAKDLGQRYPDDAELIADLEDVLGDRDRARRASHRRGDRGPPHAPGRTRRRVPWRGLHPRAVLALLALVAAPRPSSCVVTAADSIERGTGSRAVKPPPGLHVRLARRRAAAKDYDPFGDDGEHPDRGRGGRRPATRTRPGRPRRYTAAQPRKPGVGLYVDAKPGVAARAST